LQQVEGLDEGLGEVGWGDVFSSNLSVLVNGSPTEQVDINKRVEARGSLNTLPFPFGGRGGWSVNEKGGGVEFFQRVPN
jgi:hypothetical protein